MDGKGLVSSTTATKKKKTRKKFVLSFRFVSFFSFFFVFFSFFVLTRQAGRPDKLYNAARGPGRTESRAACPNWHCRVVSCCVAARLNVSDKSMLWCVGAVSLPWTGLWPIRRASALGGPPCWACEARRVISEHWARYFARAKQHGNGKRFRNS